ncbi:uncharacterized protein LOC128337666 [Hemicordylus capensis]|uniref:uncharacterized protein LOC128337666 n=1 Tax=Hemicordylus capensis TaxID=884348 RepID=UPI00230481A3|nr:uncharacterized protein LOC128337666 [Hemicordylus capensis]
MLLLAKYLLLSSTVLHAQPSLHQMPRFEFVEVGSRARISCTSEFNIKAEGSSFSWYRRRKDEISLLMDSCKDGDTDGKFACKVEGHKLTLEISNSQPADSGLYFCAQGIRNLFFSSGTTSLIVGDSYTPSTRVILLLPSAHPTSKSVQSDRLACVVHGASNLVQVSWSISGDLWEEEQTFLARTSSGSLTFISLPSLPMDSQMSEKSYTCEVRFNSSNTTVKKSISFPTAPSADLKENCLNYAVTVAVLGVSASLLLLLSCLWSQLCPSGPASPAGANHNFLSNKVPPTARAMWMLLLLLLVSCLWIRLYFHPN